jgi:hypothetical protein
LQKVDLVFERLSLLHELNDHSILPGRRRAASPVARFNDIARKSEERNTQRQDQNLT